MSPTPPRPLDTEAFTRAHFEALTRATLDVVYRMSADWSEMQPLDGRGLVPSNDTPIRDWMSRNLPPDEHARVAAAIAHAVANRSVFELEHRVFRPGGEEGWTYSRAVPISGADGQLVEWLGVARDVTDARRAKDALQESEQRFRAVFEQSTGGIVQTDLQGRLVLVNDRFCEIVGRAREALLGLRMSDLTHPEDVAASHALLQEVVQGRRQRFTLEKRYVRPDGSCVWVQNAVSAIRGPDGRARYVNAIVADITELRGAREAQAELAAQRQLALDAARLGWWHYDPHSGMVTHDARYGEIYGLDGARRRHVDEVTALLHPEDAPRLWAAVEAAMQPLEPAPYAVEYRIQRTDGALRWLEARGMATFEGRGPSRTLSSFVGTVADVTERRLADQVLRENEARFRLMADASPAALWLTAPDGACTFLSAQWYEFTGQTEAEAMGLGWTRAIHPDDRDAASAAFLAANASRGMLRAEYRLRMADGSHRWVADLGRPWFAENGVYAGMVGVVMDIDARKDAERGLEEANRRKDQFLATLAHELRNPLAPISNALQVWPHLEHKPQEAARLREMMGRQVRQMVRLIDDLLDVSRITRGKIELQLATIDLRVALGAAIEAQKPFLDAHAHRLEVSLPGAPLLLRADHSRLVQVFGNLLHNAAKYTAPGGDIRIAAAREGACVRVVVSDTGIGIPREMLATVFEMFTQVDQALGRKHGGLGIGLTLVKNLVELHGGSIDADSAGADQGSRFTVRLPALADAGADPPPPAADAFPAERARACRVLVVDDVQASADTFALMLQGLGQDARAVYDGAAALQAMQSFRPEIAFIDLAMPGMDGYDVVRRARAAPGGAPFLVALTGFGQEEARQRALQAGYDHHLVKPASLEAVNALLLDVAGRLPPRTGGA